MVGLEDLVAEVVASTDPVARSWLHNAGTAVQT
jgi:hypothetical protein